MKGMEKIGVWAFIAGLVISVIVALVAQVEGTVVWVLGALGIIVGLINIGDKEVIPYLVASVALIVGASGLATVIGAANLGVAILTKLLTAIIVFVAPGAVVVSVKAIFEVAKSK